MPPPSSSGLKKSIINRDTWPHGVSGSGAKNSTHYDAKGRGLITRPVVVPKFVANPTQEGVSGYQEVHQIYNEMRQFFARKAMSVHNGEVVVIKVTMMSLKPGYKSPSVVSVRAMTKPNTNVAN